MIDMEKHIWEGWRVKDFIEAIEPTLDMIMAGEALQQPFTSWGDLCKYIASEQPYYKQPIKEVNIYFMERYGL